MSVKNIPWILFLFALASCKVDHYAVLFSLQNNSDKPVYFTYSNKYPDTSVDNSIYIPKGKTRTPSQIVNPGQKVAQTASRSLENYFKDTPSGIMEVFIYDANLVKATSWDSVVANYLVLKRYNLTLDDLKKLNGVINYP